MYMRGDVFRLKEKLRGQESQSEEWVCLMDEAAKKGSNAEPTDARTTMS